jgi:tRNA threonylcarbamoyladenosine biosynthesis protein TsaE
MPILDPRTVEFFSRSPEQTRRLGVRLGSLLQPGDLVCLSGDLGAGKTTLVQGISQGWGSLDIVSSPTFVLVNEYRRPDGRCLFHLDAYRLASAWEAEDLDIDRMIEAGPLVVEWPERIKTVLPGKHLWIALRWIADEQRGMTFNGLGERYTELLAEFRKKVFGG